MKKLPVKKTSSNPYIKPTHDKCANKKCKNTCDDVSMRVQTQSADGTLRQVCSMDCGFAIRWSKKS